MNIFGLALCGFFLTLGLCGADEEFKTNLKMGNVEDAKYDFLDGKGEMALQFFAENDRSPRITEILNEKTMQQQSCSCSQTYFVKSTCRNCCSCIKKSGGCVRMINTGLIPTTDLNNCLDCIRFCKKNT